MARPSKYSEELRERAVRMVDREQQSHRECGRHSAVRGP